jgi:hypothetical protein
MLAQLWRMTCSLGEDQRPALWLARAALRACLKCTTMSANTVRPLRGSKVLLKSNIGSFDNEEDDRVKLANHRHCYSTRRNISTSFDTENMICNTCTGRGKHRVLRRETERADTVDDSPVKICRFFTHSNSKI